MFRELSPIYSSRSYLYELNINGQKVDTDGEINDENKQENEDTTKQNQNQPAEQETSETGNEEPTYDTDTENEDIEPDENNTNDNNEDETDDDPEYSLDDDDINSDEEPTYDTDTENEDIEPDENNTNDNNEDETDDDPDNNDIDDTESSDPNKSKIQQIEDEIYDNLSDEQKQIKNEELRKQFQILYQKCDETADNITSMRKNQETVKIYTRIVTLLNNMKEYISFYLTRSFDSATYNDNDTIFQKYLFILNGISSTIEEIYKSDENTKTVK